MQNKNNPDHIDPDDLLPPSPEEERMWAAIASESVNDTRMVTRPEDPRIETEAMSRLHKAVSDFVRREYADEVDASAFDDPSRIPIAETNVENHEEIVIDMAINVPDLALDQYVNGEKVDSWHYDSLESIVREIRNISFDELVSLGPNAQEKVDRMTGIMPEEHDFLRNPEDGFAIYQLKRSAGNGVLLFSSMNDLRQEARRMRDDVHRVVGLGLEALYPSKEAAEQFFRDEGFTVLPTDDPARITLRSPAMMESTVYLTYGNACCSIDGCNTSAVEQMVRHAHYDLIYTGPLPDTSIDPKDTMAVLEDLFTRFNLERPADFHGHSLSVSDVIVLKQGGQIASYYTDSFGFEQVTGFLASENYLRAAEMSMEDDYDMIDGLVNNAPKEAPERTSITDQLKECRDELAERAADHPKTQRAHDEPAR